MKCILKVIILLFLTTFVSAQNSPNKIISWHGEIIGELLPDLYSNWNTTSLGGQIAFQYYVNNEFLSSLIGGLHFIPTSSANNFEYTSMRSLSLSLSFNKNVINFNTLFSVGLGYTQGKISTFLKKYPEVFSQVRFSYLFKKRINLFINISSIYDISNDNLTPSFKIGYIADFIIISFEFTQLIKWENWFSRLNNELSVPHITNHN